jgi:hypothetical protein
MKKFLILLSSFSIINFTFAQIIDCNELINIDLLEEKMIHDNSYSEGEIIADKNILSGMIVSETSIKLTNGSYGNLNENSFFIASISSCETMKSQSKAKIEKNYRNEEQQIMVYPNPTTDFVKVKWSNQKVEAVFLTTIEGKTLKTQSVFNKTDEVLFDVSNLAKGIYQVMLFENQKRTVFKIIKN